ncbi:AAA family ATPase [Methylotenera versatilis]|uniref:AAA family ATPase n=1 Tax=Methylotenera versatilis TaxID=1055487 RepID=UPI000646310F|nr:MoxR family ATPase [Methylotenera versatilis]
MQNTINAIIQAASQVILGKESHIKLSLTCLLAGGHLLIEDLPGMGKTTLAHTLAQVLGLSFRRTQFTSDLLPADIIGVSVFDRNTSNFQFHPGPIFSNVLLADEINRATPKTQSALLEAMEEHQVTVDGNTHLLPSPFFVIATQNPKHHIGTFALPESQLDRFLMRITLGYPDSQSERALLQNKGGRANAQHIQAVCDGETLLKLQQNVSHVHVSDALLDYLQALIQYTRTQFNTGLSPRAGLGLRQCAQAWAMCEGRDFVIPEDIQAVLPSVVTHRLQTDGNINIAKQILDNVAI